MPSMVQRERWERMVPRAVSIASRTPAILWARRLGRATMDTSETVLGLSSATVKVELIEGARLL